jgi:hypothetical protein
LSWALLIVSVIGCSNTATIHRRSGPPVEARIIAGTPEAIVVTHDGRRGHTIARGDIEEIDHPGNVHGVIGGILAAYGVVNIALGLPICSDQHRFGSSAEQAAFCTGVFAPVTLGAAMLFWGWVTLDASTSAAADRSYRLPKRESNEPAPVLR